MLSSADLHDYSKGISPKHRKWPMSARPGQRILQVMRNPPTVPKPLLFPDDTLAHNPKIHKQDKPLDKTTEANTQADKAFLKSVTN